MPDIRPISDLRSRFAEISKTAHEKTEPIFLTKNGYGDLVVMSIEAYEELKAQGVSASSADISSGGDETHKKQRENSFCGEEAF